MNRKKILTVLGARPQFIKSKALSKALADSGSTAEIIVHTGQHYDYQMCKIFLRELDLPEPKYFLGINRCDNLIQVKRMLTKLVDVMDKERPELVIVYGDTNSTLAGALAAKFCNIRLAHIEAGLRSFRKEMAEELNRVVTDRLSDLLFAPVKEAVRNLSKEDMKGRIYLTGDVLYDVLLDSQDKIAAKFKDVTTGLGIKEDSYCFLTLHRAETVDDGRRLELVLRALGKIDKKVIFSLHPRTKKRIKEFKLGRLIRGFCCICPQSYITSLSLIKNAAAVLTDSGGVQREAYMLKTPCVTLRNETEWNQTLRFGWNRIIEVKEKPLQRLPLLLGRICRPRRYEYIFGDGKAALKISRTIEWFLTG